jgi:hypothetical protein
MPQEPFCLTTEALEEFLSRLDPSIFEQVNEETIQLDATMGTVYWNWTVDVAMWCLSNAPGIWM